jgi:uncharacterized protein YeaO (DUF488 family)
VATGLSKADARLDCWLKDVAPSQELRRWYGHDPSRAAEFADRYGAELEHESRTPALEQLLALLDQGPVTLLTATRDVAHSHAMVLAERLRQLRAARQDVELGDEVDVEMPDGAV